MPSALNAEDVAARLERLREEYDPQVEFEDATLEPAGFDELAEYAREGYTGGGYALVVREDPPPLSDTMPDAEGLDEAYPRVLLGLGRGGDGWGPAGGGRESGETYEAAAEREVREETGVACEVTDCLAARRLTHRREGRTEEIHTLWTVFEAGDAGGSIDVQESELHGAAWFHTPPANLHPAVADVTWPVG